MLYQFYAELINCLSYCETLLAHDRRDQRGRREEDVNGVVTLAFLYALEHAAIDKLVNAFDDVAWSKNEQSAERQAVERRELLQLLRRLAHKQGVETERQYAENAVLAYSCVEAIPFLAVVSMHVLTVDVPLLVLFEFLPHHLDKPQPAHADPAVQLLREGQNAGCRLFTLSPLQS